MACPVRFNSAMSANSRRVSVCDRLLVGSSSTRTRHPTASARPISTSCWAAGERLDRRIDRNFWMAELREHISRRLPHRGAPDKSETGRLHPEQDVLGDGHVRVRATTPGRSSPRPRAARRADARAGRERRRASCDPRRAAAPDRIAISVLLPAPFCPTMAQTSPGATDRSTPSTASVAPKAFRMPRISKRGVPVMASPMECGGRSGALLVLQPAIQVGLQLLDLG